MNVNKKSCLELIFEFEWDSCYANHKEIFYVAKVNLWRDYLNTKILDSLIDREKMDEISIFLQKGELLPLYQNNNVLRLKKTQFNAKSYEERIITPKIGRFYPKGFLRDVSGIYPGNIEPFRVVGFENSHLNADMNNPLSPYDIKCNIKILDVFEKNCDMGGQFNSWIETILESGPGMQARHNKIPTDFTCSGAFIREDNTEDLKFYKKSRLVGHIDKKASEHICEFYKKTLKKGFKVLDLMSSYESHLPPDMDLDVAGLGLNEEELRNNSMLKEFVIHDLNQEQSMPFKNACFDAIICNLSVEYLTNPLKIVSEANRILKDNGIFIVTFSNRWFPQKVINIWKELHEFERMGFVLEIFIQNDNFRDMQTISIRNWDRPADDPHYFKTRVSDPVYIVSGVKK